MFNDTLNTDEELMREIKANNMLAFDILFKRYSKKLYRFAFTLLKSNEDAENLVQDVFLNLFESRENVEKDASVKSYIFTIAYNSAVSTMRKKSRDLKFLEYLKSVQEPEQEAVDAQIEFNELSDRLDKVISHLPERQKEVYILHKIKGFTYLEIAREMDISVNTVENHMSRALKTIREKIGAYSVAGLLFCCLFL